MGCGPQANLFSDASAQLPPYFWNRIHEPHEDRPHLPVDSQEVVSVVDCCLLPGRLTKEPLPTEAGAVTPTVLFPKYPNHCTEQLQIHNRILCHHPLTGMLNIKPVSRNTCLSFLLILFHAPRTVPTELLRDPQSEEKWIQSIFFWSYVYISFLLGVRSSHTWGYMTYLLLHGFFIWRFPYLVCKANLSKGYCNFLVCPVEFSLCILGPMSHLGWKDKDMNELESSMAVSELSSLFTLGTGVENAESRVSGLIARLWCSLKWIRAPTTDLFCCCSVEHWDTWSSTVESRALRELQLWEGGRLYQRKAFKKINDRWLN